MIHITQLIYIKPGEEATFHRFEEVAIPIIQRYNGKLLLRVRPDPNEIIEANTEIPYEIHWVSFESEDDFENFKHDKERLQFLHLKEQSIKSSVLIKGIVI
ncbi:MAG TPA: DUF1330 domain-containing protein [Chryseolinea sp.]|nr:DUF1330 domain-containing protein [Chryseolinea sp.]HPM29048.1 DUF1330 domain-containing protein [Chryseolinea sp.]